jgi:hypothetical protein
MLSTEIGRNSTFMTNNNKITIITDKNKSKLKKNNNDNKPPISTVSSSSERTDSTGNSGPDLRSFTPANFFFEILAINDSSLIT